MGNKPGAARTPGSGKTWPLPTKDSTKEPIFKHLSGFLPLHANLANAPKVKQAGSAP